MTARLDKGAGTSTQDKPDIRFCRSKDGTRIAHGAVGAGPPIVRVANWLTHLNLDWQSPVWSHWLRDLSSGFQLVCYDPRGTGLSDRRAGSFTLDDWVSDLEAVVDDRGLRRFHLLGFCQGGPVAIAYAARHPERIDRLVLYDSYAFGALTPGVPSDQAKQASALAEMIEVGWGKRADAFRKLFSDLLIPDSSPEAKQWLAEFERRTVSAETASQLWRAFHKLDVRQLASQVQAPTLVFHVRGDEMVPFEAGRVLAASIPDARFVPLDGSNHILAEHEPGWGQFLSEVRAFLSDSNLGASNETVSVDLSEFTPREREILALIAQGLANQEIAKRLTVTPKTVRNHVSHIYSKLGVSTRAKAVVAAREADLG